jgi:hypothetical protein
MRPTARSPRWLSLGAACAWTLTAGCAHDTAAPGVEAEAPAPPVVEATSAPPATAAEATSAPPAAGGATEPQRPRLGSFAVVTGAAWKACEPGEQGATTSELKLLHGLANVCLSRRMVSELDRVLWPLKASGSPRFHSLMQEQAVYNRFVVRLGELVEQAMWIDLESGVRTYGSCYDCGVLACETSSAKERLYLALALQAGDTAALAARIAAAQKAGSETQGKVRELAAAAAAWSKRPASDHAEGQDHAGPEDWRGIAGGARDVEAQAADLAASTCAGVPGLAAALGGEESCRESARVYYLGQCSFL